MPELIDKGKLLFYLEAIKPDEHVTAYGEAAIDVINHIENYVSEMPTAEQPTIEAEPVRRGRWIAIDDKTARCSCCRWYQKARRAASISEGSFGKVYRFCTACGARMDGGADNG